MDILTSKVFNFTNAFSDSVILDLVASVAVWPSTWS